jgi:hypothetical protein
MSEKKYSIDDLYSDNDSFDEDQVVKILHKHITIQKDTKMIFFKKTSLSVEKRILAYALAKKLMGVKKIIDNPKLSAKEFHEATGIKKGSIDPGFKRLKENGLLVGQKEYEIPNHSLSQILESLAV